MSEDDLPSLRMMLDHQMRALDLMRGSVEAIDRKATVIVVGSGVLIGLSPEMPAFLLAPALVAVLVAGGLAVAALWPRKFPALIPRRKYLPNAQSHTEGVLYTTYEAMLKKAYNVLFVKEQMLKRSVVGFMLAGLFFAAGVLWEAAEGGEMPEEETPEQPPEGADEPAGEEPETPVTLPDPDPEMMGHIVGGDRPEAERFEDAPPEDAPPEEG